MSRVPVKRPFSNSTNYASSYEPPAKIKTICEEDDDDDPDLGHQSIKVFVRVRPENERESKTKRIIQIIDEKSLLFDPLTKDGNTFTYHGKKYKDIGKKANKDLEFTFDAVFHEGATNIQVYERAVKGLVQSLFDGFNCTIFAYGPTGSGKTFTMLGYNGDPGVIIYTAMEIFHNIEQGPSIDQYEVCVAYFEIYNEKVYDLLTPSSQVLKVVDSMCGGVNILGLTTRIVASADELIETLETGNQYRAQQATDVNVTSSRSHAIFQLFLRKKTNPKGTQLVTKETKMCLVDLAGSERASIAYKEKRSKTLHREGGNINKSLLALGNCINALAFKSRKGIKKHIPYRSSVLTRILSDSLGGNCRTAMIATVSPSSLSYDDTHNTLSYANRTKGINLALKRINSVIAYQPHHQQQAALDALKQENIALQEKNILLEQKIAQLKRLPANPITTDSSSIDILNSYKIILDEMFNTRLDARRKLLECESEIKKIELKSILRNMLKDSLQQNKASDGEESKYDAARYLYHQKLHYEDRLHQLNREVTHNENSIRDLEELIRSKVATDDYFINSFFREKHMEVELQDKIITDKHHSEVSYVIITQAQVWLETLDAAMKLTHIFFRMLDALKKLSKEREEEYQNVVRRFEGKKSVVWGDDNLIKSSNVHWADIDNILKLSSYTSTPRTPFRRGDEGGLEIICSGLTPSSISPPSPSATLNSTFSIS